MATSYRKHVACPEGVPEGVAHCEVRSHLRSQGCRVRHTDLQRSLVGLRARRSAPSGALMAALRAIWLKSSRYFCARRAAFFSRRRAARARRCLAWIFLRRESVIFGMGVNPLCPLARGELDGGGPVSPPNLWALWSIKLGFAGKLQQGQSVTAAAIARAF